MSSPILFLSAHLPVECSRQAGHKTAWRNLGWLAERHPVHLIAFRSEGDRAEPLDALRARCERLEVVDVTRGLRLHGLPLQRLAGEVPVVKLEFEPGFELAGQGAPAAAAASDLAAR